MSDNLEQLEDDVQDNRAALRGDLDKIFNRLSPGQLVDEALNQAGGAKRFASGLGEQVRDNPMPVMLTGLGLAWVAASSRGESGSGQTRAPRIRAIEVDPDDYDADFAARRIEIAEAECKRAGHDSDTGYQRELCAMRARALEIERDEDESEEGFTDRVSKAADAAREQASTARSRISDSARKVREGASSAMGAAKHAGGSVADAGQAGASKVKHLHEDNPLVTGAIALALGALVGSLIPLSHREEETLKNLADRARDGVAGMAGEAANKMHEARGDIGSGHNGAGDRANGDIKQSTNGRI